MNYLQGDHCHLSHKQTATGDPPSPTLSISPSSWQTVSQSWRKLFTTKKENMCCCRQETPGELSAILTNRDEYRFISTIGSLLPFCWHAFSPGGLSFQTQPLVPVSPRHGQAAILGLAMGTHLSKCWWLRLS